MAVLESIRHGDVLELRLARGPVNALDPELVGALRAALDSAFASGVRGIVLSGREGMFSGGLDVPLLLSLDRPAMQRFWGEFIGLCETLARAPVPIVAAITGHSPAGGAVLSLYCDYRIMARGDFRIGLNEVAVGLVVPEVIQAALRRLVGPYRAERLMVSGSMVDAATAAGLGLVDELAEVDQVVARALAWLGELLALPPEAMTETRRIARADLGAAFDRKVLASDEEFADRWFSTEAQGVLKAVVERLKAKRG